MSQAVDNARWIRQVDRWHPPVPMTSSPPPQSTGRTRLRRSIASVAAVGVIAGIPALTAAPAHGQVVAAAGVSSVAAVPAATTYQLGERTLRWRDTGPDVKALQRLLRVERTGTFNRRTRAKVMMIERKYGLRVDGIVEPRTLKLIKIWARAKEKAAAALPDVGTPEGSRRYARAYINFKHGWRARQMDECLKPMWERESTWRWWVSNPNGRYHGIPQTSSAVWRSYGFTDSQYMNRAEVQIKVGANYIKGRYGNPCKAWNFWKSHHWY